MDTQTTLKLFGPQTGGHDRLEAEARNFEKPRMRASPEPNPFSLFDDEHHILSNPTFEDEDWIPKQLRRRRLEAQGVSQQTNDEANELALLDDFEHDRKALPATRLTGKLTAATTRALHRKTARYISILIRAMENGDEYATRCVATYAVWATKSMQPTLDKHPKTFTEIAGSEFAWPVLVSPHPKFCSAKPDWARLGLGTHYPFPLHASSKYNPNDQAGALAMKLWMFVNVRRDKVKQMQGNPQRGKAVQAWLKEHPDSIEKLLLKLPDYSADSQIVGKWWNVAEMCLVEAVPHPKEKGAINEGSPRFAGVVTSPKDNRTPGRLRGRILERLEKKFYWFAGLNPDQPVAPSGRK